MPKSDVHWTANEEPELGWSLPLSSAWFSSWKSKVVFKLVWPKTATTRKRKPDSSIKFEFQIKRVKCITRKEEFTESTWQQRYIHSHQSQEWFEWCQLAKYRSEWSNIGKPLESDITVEDWWTSYDISKFEGGFERRDSRVAAVVVENDSSEGSMVTWGEAVWRASNSDEEEQPRQDFSRGSGSSIQQESQTLRTRPKR